MRFTAGDFGSVVVQLSDARGQELELDGHVSLGVQFDSGTDPSLALHAGAHAHRPCHAGRARFACVGLGRSLDIGVGAQGRWRARREHVGPTQDGEELRVLVPVGARQAIARGRVHGVDAHFSEREPAGARLLGTRGQDTRALAAWLPQDGDFENPLWSALPSQ